MRWAWFSLAILLITGSMACKKTDSSLPSGTDDLVITHGDADVIVDSTDYIVADTSNISGIDYIDDIYDLTISDGKAIPVYHSPISVTLPCSGNDSTATDACVFDETDVNLDGKADIPGARKNKLFVDPNTGIIDLRASMQAGIFGPNLFNGKKKRFNFFYRLNDETQRKLQKITVEVVFYQTPSDIPESVKAEIALRKTQYSITYSTMLMAYTITYQPKRPPLIVIVSRL